MTHAYCPAKHAGTPAHTCLCYHQPAHHGGHECRCGHYWGINWNTMTYNEQWQFLGLPPVINVSMDDLRVALLGLIQANSNFPPERHEEDRRDRTA